MAMSPGKSLENVGPYLTLYWDHTGVGNRSDFVRIVPEEFFSDFFIQNYKMAFAQAATTSMLFFSLGKKWKI